MTKQFLFACCLLVSGFMQAQQFGGYSPATRWNQINNDTLRVIFPQGTGLEKQAADVAATIQKLAIQTAPTIGSRLRKISIVLHPYTTISNAYVALGPWRSEFYLMPPQNPFDLGTTPWSHSLALHEFRHVQQYNNFRKGLSRVAYYLFGQEGLALANGAAVPNWFWEGDAVYQETLKSRQGRGRLSAFFNDYRSLWVAGKNYSWMKLRNGSLRDFVPDHYRLGYMEVAYGREQYGPDFWKKVTDDAVRFNGVFYPFQHAIKKYTNTSYKAFRQHAIDHFKASTDTIGAELVNNWASQQKHFDGDEEFPQWVDEHTIVLVKSSYKKIPAFYLRNVTTGADTHLQTKSISLDNYFSYRNGRIVYAAYESDVRWSWKNYSVVRVLDIHTGRERVLTHQTKYFAPDIAADGRTIVAVEVQPGGGASLHLLDATTGAVLKKVPNPKGLFYSHPKFYGEGTILAAVRSNTGENTLALVHTNDGSTEELLPPSNRVVGFPSVKGDTITFTAAGPQQDLLMALVKKQLYLVEAPGNNATGNYQFSVFNGRVVYTAFTAAGYHMIERYANEANWQPVSAEAFVRAPFAAYELAGLQTDQPVGVDTTRPYPVSRYHKAFNLVNFHSWRPYISDPDYTFSLIGENVLNTLQTEIYFNYNTNEKYKEVGATAIYGALFPYLTLGVAETFDRRETDTPYRSWNELNGRLGLQFPFTFNSGRFYRSLNLSGGINHHQVNFTQAAKTRFADQQFDFFDASVSFTMQSQMARQHIYPRWGVSFLSRYRQIVNHYSGYQWLTSASLYVPGLARTHNLVINGAYQKRDTVGDYSFGSSFPIARGYPSVNQYSIPDMYKLGVNYHFPLLYPDLGIANIVYFLRVRGNAFFDYTYLKFFRDNRYLEFKSTGGEVFFDTKWWNEYNVSFGFRYSRMLNQLRGYDPNQWEFILPINLLGR